MCVSYRSCLEGKLLEQFNDPCFLDSIEYYMIQLKKRQCCFFLKKEKNCLFLQAQYAVCFVCISYHDTYEFQEKFERDQQRIRQQYEEEKRRAREAEKQREEQVINEIHRR